MKARSAEKRAQSSPAVCPSSPPLHSSVEVGGAVAVDDGAAEPAALGLGEEDDWGIGPSRSWVPVTHNLNPKLGAKHLGGVSREELDGWLCDSD